MENLPLIILKKIFQYLPRRIVEDVVLEVCDSWQLIGQIVLSEEIHISDFCNLPPGFNDDIDLNLTRRISISSGWTCKWWECEGLKRDYFEDLLRQLSPNALEAISTPIRNEDQMAIIGELTNLKRVQLQVKKPVLSHTYLSDLTRLRNLESVHLEGVESFDAGHLKAISTACSFITEFSFPRGTPWAEEEYLTILRDTQIRKISPWSYIGGDGEGQSYPLLIDVLASITDLSQIEIYIDHVYPYPGDTGINLPVRDQSSLFPLMISNLTSQTCLERISIFKTVQRFPIGAHISELFTTLSFSLKSINLVGFCHRNGTANKTHFTRKKNTTEVRY